MNVRFAASGLTVVALLSACSPGAGVSPVSPTASATEIRTSVRDALKASDSVSRVHLLSTQFATEDSTSKLDVDVIQDPFEAVGTMTLSDGEDYNVRFKDGKQTIELGPDNLKTMTNDATWGSVTWFEPLYDATAKGSFSEKGGAAVVDGSLGWVLDKKSVSKETLAALNSVPATYTFELNKNGQIATIVMTRKKADKESLNDGYPYTKVERVYSKYKD
jgi:hypothetical protein